MNLLKYKNELLLIGLFIYFCIESFFVIELNLKAFYRLSILDFTIQLLIQSNIIIYSFFYYVLLQKNYTISKYILSVVIFIFAIYIISQINIICFRHNNPTLIDFFNASLLHLIAILIIKTVYKVRFFTKKNAVIFTILMSVIIVLLPICYIKLNNVYDFCSKAKTENDFIFCMIKLNADQIKHHNKIDGPHVLKIFRDNPEFKQQVEIYNYSRVLIKDEYIIWIPNNQDKNLFPK